MLRIKRGSVFDEKCDLLVLPCSSSGSVTSWVRREIEQNNLPFSSVRTPFGQIGFFSTEARYTKSDFVAYAASVDATTTSSTRDAIETITSSLIGYCKTYDCSIVNIPLLGTGAGGLNPVEVFDIYRKILSDDSAVFNIYVPDKRVYELIVGHRPLLDSPENSIDEHPRVFISYSWKDDSVRTWVLELAKQLCANGVDARLDKFHLRPGMDVPQWMTNEVLKARKVLLICDSHYAEKADMRKAGVGWETMIIQGDMMLQGDMNAKYIAIAYGDFEKNTPIYMKSKLGISKIDIDKDIKLLLHHIFDVDISPEIGKVPEWVKGKRKFGNV
jgi:hypothetical protein